jgi:hypothetical protein
MQEKLWSRPLVTSVKRPSRVDMQWQLWHRNSLQVHNDEETIYGRDIFCGWLPNWELDKPKLLNFSWTPSFRQKVENGPYIIYWLHYHLPVGTGIQWTSLNAARFKDESSLNSSTFNLHRWMSYIVSSLLWITVLKYGRLNCKIRIRVAKVIVVIHSISKKVHHAGTKACMSMLR